MSRLFWVFEDDRVGISGIYPLTGRISAEPKPVKSLTNSKKRAIINTSDIILLFYERSNYYG